MTKNEIQREKTPAAEGSAAAKGAERRTETITVWAVGHVKDPLFVALQINEHAPFLLRIPDARKISAALQSEVDAISKQKPSSGDE